MIRITNQQMSEYVTNRVEFTNSKKSAFARFMWGVESENLYCVFSYGLHFPMYVHDGDTNMWFGNTDKASRTTSRHQTQAQPNVRPGTIQWMDLSEIKELIVSRGYLGLCERRLTGRRLVDMPGRAPL